MANLDYTVHFTSSQVNTVMTANGMVAAAQLTVKYVTPERLKCAVDGCKNEGTECIYIYHNDLPVSLYECISCHEKEVKSRLSGTWAEEVLPNAEKQNELSMLVKQARADIDNGDIEDGGFALEA